MMCRGSSACVINAFAEGSGVDIGDIGGKAGWLLGMRWTVGVMLNPEAQWGLYKSETWCIDRTQGSTLARCL